MVSSHGQFSITNSLLTLTMQNPLISTVASYQSVNRTYPGEKGDLSQRGTSCRKVPCQKHSESSCEAAQRSVVLYDSATCPCDSHAEHARAMEIAPSNVAGAMLRGDQRRKIYPSEELLDSHSCGRPPDSNPWNRGFLL